MVVLWTVREGPDYGGMKVLVVSGVDFRGARGLDRWCEMSGWALGSVLVF